MSYGDRPFGLRDVKLTDITGTTQVDLPAAQTLNISERMVTAELEGDDALQSVVTFVQAIEWTLESGGISLDAYEIITGRTVAVTGSTPNEVSTLTTSEGDNMPYFKIYGKSLGEGDDDIHVLIFKAKCQSLEGNFQGGQFFITNCSGVGIDDGTNGIYDIVQNETATALPST